MTIYGPDQMALKVQEILFGSLNSVINEFNIECHFRGRGQGQKVDS